MEIIGSAILAVAQSILFYGKSLGISMLLFEIICNGIILYVLNKNGKIKNKRGFLFIIPIILLGSTYFIFANTTLYILNIFAILLLNFMMYVVLINEKSFFVNYLSKTFNLVTDTVTGYKEGFEFSKQKSKDKIKTNANKENVKKNIVSILIVLIVAIIIISLLASADMIFANLFSGIGKMFENINIGTAFNIILRIAIIVFMYFLFLSFILKLKKDNVQEENSRPKTKNNNNFTIKLLLIVLNVVYFVFCFIQLQSLFARLNINRYDYASYARTGFFQLMFVSIINFVLIIISNKCEGKDEKLIKKLNLLLVVFTIIIAISAMYRMYLYSSEYGLTYLRFFVYAILITEILAFIPVIKYIFDKKFDFMKYCFMLAVFAYCIVNAINLEKYIVTYNVNRPSGSHETDYQYILSIASEDSYEFLNSKLQDEKTTEKEKLEISKILSNIISNTKKMSWQEFNISKHKMQQEISDLDLDELNSEIKEKEKMLKEQEKINETNSKEYVYKERVSKEETYIVETLYSATGQSKWQISKITNNRYEKINEIEVPAPSKIEFFEDGLGFLEMPDNVYCAKADLFITNNSGKTFSKITFPDGEFTLSDPHGEKWKNCYDYFYLPTREEDGTLTVLVSGGYEGGYNGGRTRAKYISKDKGKTWQFIGEIWKEE